LTWDRVKVDKIWLNEVSFDSLTDVLTLTTNVRKAGIDIPPPEKNHAFAGVYQPKAFRIRPVRPFFRVTVCGHNTISSWTRYLTNCSWEFHEIYNTGAFGEKMKCLYFEVQKGQTSRSGRDQVRSDILLKCTFQAKAYLSTAHLQRRSSFSGFQ